VGSADLAGAGGGVQRVRAPARTALRPGGRGRDAVRADLSRADR
jgi:hypothetical protein